MTLKADQRSVQAGQSVTVPVWLIKAHDVANMNFELTYTPNVARAGGTVVKGNLLDRALFEANPNEAGIVRIGFAQKDDLSGTGTVAQIPFTATGQPGDRTPLHLVVTTINGASGAKPAIATIDGEIVILGPGGKVPWDTDGDGKLTAREALDALKMSVRLIPVDMNADADKDGQVTSNDAKLILQKVVGG